MAHRFRFLVHKESNISDAELDELVALIGEDKFYSFWDSQEYEFNGNHVLTDSEAVFHELVREMCCGIYTTSFALKSGKAVYFAFDYGH